MIATEQDANSIRFNDCNTLKRRLYAHRDDIVTLVLTIIIFVGIHFSVNRPLFARGTKLIPNIISATGFVLLSLLVVIKTCGVFCLVATNVGRGEPVIAKPDAAT